MTICPLTSACDPKRELQRRICNHYGDAGTQRQIPQ
jgi:hypothetical protein